MRRLDWLQRILKSKAIFPLLIGFSCLLVFLISTHDTSDNADTVNGSDLEISGVQLPADFRDTLVHYATVERRDGTIRDLYINAEAVEAVRNRGFLPDDTIMVIEGFDGQRDDDGELLIDTDGHYVKDTPLEMIHVAHQNSQWQAEDFVDDTRLANWNFGSFNSASLNPFDEPIAPCFQCHSPHGGPFTLNTLRSFAQTGELQYVYCDQTGRSPCAFMTN